MPESKPWARMREHGPSLIFDWYESQEAAERGIDDAEKMYGGAVRKVQVVAYFPHRDNSERESTIPEAWQEMSREFLGLPGVRATGIIENLGGGYRVHVEMNSFEIADYEAVSQKEAELRSRFPGMEFTLDIRW